MSKTIIKQGSVKFINWDYKDEGRGLVKLCEMYNKMRSSFPMQEVFIVDDPNLDGGDCIGKIVTINELTSHQLMEAFADEEFERDDERQEYLDDNNIIPSLEYE